MNRDVSTGGNTLDALYEVLQNRSWDGGPQVNNWKVVTGEDGSQYYEVEARFYGTPVPQTVTAKIQAPGGVTFQDDFDRGVGFSTGPLWRAMEQQDGFDVEPWQIKACTWLPDAPAPTPEPEPPTGRFQNLDWDT